MIDPRPRRHIAVLLCVLMLVAIAACSAPRAGARASTLPVTTADASLPPAVTPAPRADVEAADAHADAADDACASAFTGPHYEVPHPEGTKPRVGQPATLAGAKSALCGRHDGCNLTMLFPAGGDDDSGDEWSVARVDSALHTSYEASGCGLYVDYFLVVANAGKITRVQWLVETGETCMHWRGEQVTVGPNLFVWRDSGYGSPMGVEGQRAWESKHYSIELSTLRVNGCLPPPPVLRGPLVPHPFA